MSWCLDLKDTSHHSYKSCKHYMMPRHSAFYCCACFGIKNINVSTRFDQIHLLFHKILSTNIILKSIKGHNSVEKLMCISHNMDHIHVSMHKQNFMKTHSLFLKILRKIEILTSIKGHNSVEKFGKIMCISHNMDNISMHKQNCFKIHTLFLKILRKIERRNLVVICPIFWRPGYRY